MAHMEKFTESAVANQLRHIERTIQHPSNTDIDSSRSHQNYSLLSDRGISSYDYFKWRKSQLYCYNRSDVKVMVGCIVTAPTDLPIDQQEHFFQVVHDFLSSRYGKENCIQSIVHNDESGRPHLHYCFIPVVTDLNPKHQHLEKICANDVINPKELRSFHPALQKYLNQKGFHVSIQSGITKAQGGNRTVRQMKQERTMERGRWY